VPKGKRKKKKREEKKESHLAAAHARRGKISSRKITIYTSLD
jgi:hypothetical protein